MLTSVAMKISPPFNRDQFGRERREINRRIVVLHYPCVFSPSCPPPFSLAFGSQPSRKKTGSASLSFQKLSASDSIRRNSRRADRRYLTLDFRWLFRLSGTSSTLQVILCDPPDGLHNATLTHDTSEAIKISSRLWRGTIRTYSSPQNQLSFLILERLAFWWYHRSQIM